MVCETQRRDGVVRSPGSVTQEGKHVGGGTAFQACSGGYHGRLRVAGQTVRLSPTSDMLAVASRSATSYYPHIAINAVEAENVPAFPRMSLPPSRRDARSVTPPGWVLKKSTSVS